jgi:hypothetical protein
MLDTKKFLALPEAQFLIPIMVAVNDLTLHETISSNVQTAITIHRRDNDLTANEMTLLEAQLELLSRHSFGLVWECLELMKNLEKKAPTIIAFLSSFPEIKNFYDLVKPYYQSEELCRIRNNLSFHFGLDHKSSFKTLHDGPSRVLISTMNEELWYEIASESQAHLFTRPITKIVKDDLTDKEVFAKAEEKGLDMKTVRFNLLTLFKTIAETFIEECYLPK